MTDILDIMSRKTDGEVQEILGDFRVEMPPGNMVCNLWMLDYMRLLFRLYEEMGQHLVPVYKETTVDTADVRFECRSKILDVEDFDKDAFKAVLDGILERSMLRNLALESFEWDDHVEELTFSLTFSHVTLDPEVHPFFQKVYHPDILDFMQKHIERTACRMQGGKGDPHPIISVCFSLFMCYLLGSVLNSLFG